MSQKEIIVQYDSLLGRIGLLLCALSAPLWALASPLALLTLVMSLLFNPSADLFIGQLGLGFFFLLMLLTGSNLTSTFRDNRIIISEDSLSLPVYLGALNRFNADIYWQDIEKVEVSGDTGDPNKVSLKLICKSGWLVLHLKGLASSDIETLLVSLSTWLKPSALSPKLDELQSRLWEQETPSFTRLWEDELTSRFSATAYQPLPPGKKLHNHTLKILRQLAFGGWSAVYLVQEENAKLKVLKESTLPAHSPPELKEKARQMFARESAILMRLHHNRIVQVYDQFEEGDRQYLLLEYINGKTLRQLVRGQGLHELDVLDYCRQICDILTYLHSLDPPLIHRDISPDNLVLEDDKIILIDFGAANEMLGTATGTLIGKQSYMPPEQFKGKASTRSDLYALGCTLYFLLTGKDPEPLTQVSPRKAGATVSDKLSSLIESLTSQEEEDRPPSAAAVKALLT